MKTTDNNLKLNIEKAIRKAKTLLKSHSADWIAVISVYRNGFVTMNTNAPGAIDQPIYKFGVEADLERWESFRVGHQSKEISIKKEAEFIVSMLKGFEKKKITKKSQFEDTTSNDVESNIKKALKQADKILRDSPFDSFADIVVYDNGGVTMTNNKKGGASVKVTHTYGEVKTGIVGSFKVRYDKEIDVKKDCAHIMEKIKGSEMKFSIEPKSKYAGMSDDEIDNLFKKQYQHEQEIYFLGLIGGNEAQKKIVYDFATLIGVELPKP